MNLKEMEVINPPSVNVASNTTQEQVNKWGSGSTSGNNNNNPLLSCDDLSSDENILDPLRSLIFNSTIGNSNRDTEDHLLPSVHHTKGAKSSVKIVGSSNRNKFYRYSNHRPGDSSKSPSLLRKSPFKNPSIVKPTSSTSLGGNRKKSSSKCSSSSPQSKYSSQYSSVPKSDSAYSNDSCLPISRDTDFSPSSGDYSLDELDNIYAGSLTFPEQRSNRDFSDLGDDKSNSSYLRSDSAFSDLGYSYSTVPQSEYDLNDEYSPSCLRKSTSTYSDNLIISTESPVKGIPKSYSSYCYTTPENDVLGQPAVIDHLNSYVQINGSDHCSLETRIDIPTTESTDSKSAMPSLKSLLPSPLLEIKIFTHNQVDSNLDEKSDNKMKKSNTLVTLDSKDNVSASTKLHHGSSNNCSVDGCLSQSLKHSISQTLPQSIGHGLNIIGSSDSTKKAKRKSNLASGLSLPHFDGSFTLSEEYSGDTVYCKICFMDVKVDEVCQLAMCQCRFCKECLNSYVSGRIREGEYSIECPDGECGKDEGSSPGELTAEEILMFAGEQLFAMRNRHKLNAEISNDLFAVWCPKAECETIVYLKYPKTLMPTQSSQSRQPAPASIQVTLEKNPSDRIQPDGTGTHATQHTSSQNNSAATKPVKPTNLALRSNHTVRDAVSLSPDNGSFLRASLNGLQSPAEYRPEALISTTDLLSTDVAPQVAAENTSTPVEFPICPACDTEFCPVCLKDSHSGSVCQTRKHGQASDGRFSAKKLKATLMGNDVQVLIKTCPNVNCQVSIEKNAGCAQMRCKACKHIFCWYCLTSLEDDMFLRHYDKGPCRNKLGHSRASVFCHRIQLLAILLGLGILLVVASPVLFICAPCILCEILRRKLEVDDEDGY